MGRYRYKPNEIEAIQWTGHNLQEVAEFLGGRVEVSDLGAVIIEVYGGMESHAEPYDWIIRTWDGRLEYLRPDVFKRLYEEAE